MSPSVEQLANYHYLALETFRRSGAGVITPVWFVADRGRLCFSAPAHTGKVKRLRNSPRARVAPCDERGRLLGDWAEAEVRLIEGADAAAADRLLARRYGWQRRLLDAFGWLRRWRYVHYSVELRGE